MDCACKHLIFVGTYTKTGSRGIYATWLDTVNGALSSPELAVETGNPTFLALGPAPGRLYAVRDSTAVAAAFAMDAARGVLTPLAPEDSSPAGAPCHVALDHTGRTLLATHFHTGILTAMPVRADGTLGEPRNTLHRGHGIDPQRQASAHPHSSTLSPDNRFALVCDLGLDRIFTYRLDPERATLTPADPPFVAAAPGSGPRHFAFGPGGRRAYVINEIGNTIVAYDYDAVRGALAPRQTISTLPAGFSGKSSAAEIRLHPNGRFLYGSNRGHDSIAGFALDSATGELAPIEIVPCGGRGPRHFAFSPDGRWLVCAHQDSNTLCVFSVDGSSGRLTRVAGSIAVPAPVCVLFAG